MKVVILGNYPTYPFAERLGVLYQGRKISTWLIYLSKYLAKYPGIELHVISEDEYLPENKYFIHDSIHFHYLKCPKKYRAATFFIGDVIRIKKLLNIIKPDIINAHHTDEYALAALKSRFPYVITVHGIFSRFVQTDKFITRARLISYIEKYILKRAKNLIASSPFVYEAVGKITKAKFYDVENTLDEIYFIQRKNYSINHNLVYIGSIIKDKGVSFLVEAVKILKKEFPSVLLKIVGPHSQYEQKFFDDLKTYIKTNDLTDNVKFEGFVTDKEKVAILNNSTVLVHPSRLETFCLSVAEAMATGTPVVATRVGGIPYTVGNEENAILVKYGSVEELHAAIKYLFSNYDHRKNMGKRGKTEALTRFHPSVVIPNLVNVFEDIISQKKNLNAK